MSNIDNASAKAKNGIGNGKTDANDSPAKKKAKTTVSSFDDILDPTVRTPEREKAIQESYRNAKPYRHARIDNIFQASFLTTCKDQIKHNSKVNFKETDLFRVYQSIDLANLVDGSELATKMPAVMQLRQVLYSQQWRSFMERLTDLPSGTLSNQVDCACNCHAPGCHLLCHDDVIGTRKVSYILYLTEPDWDVSEGGALELYDSYSLSGDAAAIRREPETCPSKTLLPLFNSMAFFIVEPGVSFHAVQEVLGERPRLSVQGWYHAAKPPDHIEHATRSRLKEANNAAATTTTTTTTSSICDEGFAPIEQTQQEQPQTVDNSILGSDDRDFLTHFINETYLSQKAMTEIRQQFEEESSVQLRNFFKSSWASSVKAAMEGQDDDKPKVGEEGYYRWGVSEEWKLVGPSHMQRYLQYQEKDNAGMKNAAQLQSAGALLEQLKQKQLQSPAFCRYLNNLTSLGAHLGCKGQIRRFRPGLDYTVAHYGILTQKSVLDATICFAAGTGGVNAAPDGEGKDVSQDRLEADEDGQDMDEADMLWQSDDVGGFECYIEADDVGGYAKKQEGGNEPGGENAGVGSASEPADEYNADDDTNLLSVSASNNTLSLVFRDPGTMRFIKYVGSRAPSSRWDISMEYQVPEDQDDRDEQDGGNDESN
jgi:prolyl 3-hydroxylase /prolyl 3,4-dihydroxylase